MQAIDFLGKSVTVHVDRPLGSPHPKYGNLYPINYGYVPDVMAGDGMELDAFIVGQDKPLTTFEGICIAVIHRHDDNEDKIVVAAPGEYYTPGAIRNAVHFQEQHFDSEFTFLSDLTSPKSA